MKKAVMLPLVAAISGAMVGCGGGGGGGSTPPAPSLTYYTFSFYKPAEVDYNPASSCTVFDIYEDTASQPAKLKAMNYLAIGTSLDSLIKAIYSDENGVQVGTEVSTVNGSLRIALENIPNNGYVTIQEQYGPAVYAQSFSKEVLTSDTSMRNTFISVLNPASKGSCLTGNNDAPRTITSLSYANDEDASGNPNIRIYFDSQLETIESTNTSLDSIEGVNKESTMISQYRTTDRSQLFQYGFDGWNNNTMKFTGNQGTADTSKSQIVSDNLQPNKIELNVIYNNFMYELAELSVANDQAAFYHPDERLGESWAYSMSGSIAAAGWEASYQDVIAPNSWSISIDDEGLFMSNNANDAKASVSNETVDVRASIGINSEKGLQRIAYEQGDGAGYLVKHTVYTHISPTVKIPKLDLSEFDSSVADNLRITSTSKISQSYLFTENDKDVVLADFMTAFRHGGHGNVDNDSMSIVKSLQDMRYTLNNIAQTRSYYLHRYDN
ncbi:flagellar sheath protein A [Vibrio variabilis]|uniref:flagellar sheath protein A n=1 Tax=Vibrio variabilis TaxID=990271 RepID=UPI000DDC2B8F|nr:flagellar sheath protein A [Vibrio variabilis]